MAKVTMTIEDKPEGGFTVGFEFTPALEKGEIPTEAQRFGCQIADACAGQGEVLEGFADGDLLEEDED